jgi:hypothetical protein
MPFSSITGNFVYFKGIPTISFLWGNLKTRASGLSVSGKTAQKACFIGKNLSGIRSSLYLLIDRKKSLLSLNLCGIIENGHRGGIRKTTINSFPHFFLPATVRTQPFRGAQRNTEWKAAMDDKNLLIGLP